MSRVDPALLVSIVIPTRNRRDILGRCLDALVRQTYRPYEVIVVDDASSDDTPTVLAMFAAKHPEMELRWRRNEPQAGANPSRNRGIRDSKGELIAFADDDCIADPQWLGHLVAAFASDRVGAVCGRIDEPHPTNIFERAFRGTNHVFSRDGVHAARMCSANACVRRNLLVDHMLDEDRASPSADSSVSGRGDEVGLFLRLRAAGHEIRVAPDAVVLHQHRYTGRAYFCQAYLSGRASARLEYKYRLRPRTELIPLLLFYATLAMAWAVPLGWLAPVGFAVVFLAGILYSECSRKRKTVREALITLPVVVAYYNVRLLGYLAERVRLLLRRSKIQRIRLAKWPRQPEERA